MQPVSQRPYIIYRGHNGAGFWSNFSWMLQGIDYADREGLIPVVDMERHPNHYTEASEEAALELGTRNGWEYYFEQPGGMSLAEALAADPLDNGGFLHERLDLRIIPGAPDDYPAARRLREKYIRVKPAILAEADAILPPGPHPELLGVHVRGTDQRAGHYANHPLPCPVICYLERAITLDSEHRFERIFLATDELETVDEFRAHFGPRLFTIAAHRTSASQETAMDYAWLFANDRPFHRYRLGLEVLLDALLLARCGHLLAGPSNVTRGVRIFASESQRLHFLPALWWVAGPDKASIGFTRLQQFGSPHTGFSAAAHEAILEVLRDNLARVEASSVAIRLQAKEMADSLHAAQARVVAVRAQNEEIRQQIQVLGAEVKLAREIVKRLQRRVLKLIGPWTRIGWFLFPWGRPAWHQDPLQGLEIPKA